MRQTKEPIYVRVSTKGQMVLPAALREEFGIEPGTRVAILHDGAQLILRPETLAAKLAMIKKMRGITAGGPSLCDELLEDRRRERERELREEGW
ncbi:MAG: AbrB/MazE/SpoVT family DNA-binding domain-containing protein [Terracidiphilus sp.]